MKIVILYSPGGLGDVGRYAVRAALDCHDDEVNQIVVLTQHPKTLDEDNWGCACPNKELHVFTDSELKRLQIVSVTTWDEKDEKLADHIRSADAIVSALSHRQPPMMYPEMKGIAGADGNRFIVRCILNQGATTTTTTTTGAKRVVVVSSIGAGKADWPPMEWHWTGRVMGCIFNTCGKEQFEDLNLIEEMYSDASDQFDYVFVHPVGLGEDLVPTGEWAVQKEKHKDKLGIGIAKLDCARFCVQEALQPTYHRKTVVVGAPFDSKNKNSDEPKSSKSEIAV